MYKGEGNDTYYIGGADRHIVPDFSVPVLAMLRFRAKKDPVGVQEKSLSRIQGVFRFILKLAGVTYEVQGLENIPSDRAVLYVGNHRSYFDILVGLCDWLAGADRVRG